MKPENMIGKLVEIIDRESIYEGHWGFIRDWDGEHFHVSGGSIAREYDGITPIFDRDQFRIPRKLDAYINAGWLRVGENISEDGREIRKRR